MYFFNWRWWLTRNNTICHKLSPDIKKAFDSERVYNKIFLETITKSHGDEVTDFCDKSITRVNSNHTCLAVNFLDSALKKGDNYYLLVFLKNCKYIDK